MLNTSTWTLCQSNKSVCESNKSLYVDIYRRFNDCVRVFFTLDCTLHPSTSSTHSVSVTIPNPREIPKQSPTRTFKVDQGWCHIKVLRLAQIGFGSSCSRAHAYCHRWYEKPNRQNINNCSSAKNTHHNVPGIQQHQLSPLKATQDVNLNKWGGSSTMSCWPRTPLVSTLSPSVPFECRFPSPHFSIGRPFPPPHLCTSLSPSFHLCPLPRVQKCFPTFLCVCVFFVLPPMYGNIAGLASTYNR